jgi:hypothetical protein
MVVALLALFIALGGPASAARLISGSSIKKNSITTRQIRNGTLGAQDLSKAATKRLQATPSRSVGTKQLRDGAVTAAAIAPQAVDASRLADGAVGDGQLADKAVDGDKLADGAAGPGQIADGAVTASKLGVASVTAASVADGVLQTRDLGDFYGNVQVDFAPFQPNTCQQATIANPIPSSTAQSNSIADDVVSVSPGTSGWPDPILVEGNPGAGNTIRVVACRIGKDPNKVVDDPTDLIDPPLTVFQYVAFDAP